MLLHNIKLAFQQMRKYRLQSAVSIVSLAIGFACFALSSLWWRYETTYDAFHPAAENMHILVHSTDKWANSYPQSILEDAGLIIKNVPQAEHATSCCIRQLSINKNIIDGVLTADTMFLSTFQPELITGNYPQMQPDGTAAVVTETLAKKLFGSTDCIGQELRLDYINTDSQKCDTMTWGKGTYTVAAVIKDWGKHSFFRFQCIVPLNVEESAGSDNHFFSYFTVIRMHPKANADTVTAHINKMQLVHLDDSRVIPLTSFHEDCPSLFTHIVKTDYIRTFAILGLLVIVCAIFNYLSLYTIRIRMRAREQALRLVCGSTRRQLLVLLITEFLLMLCAACFLGMLFVHLLLPEFKNITYIDEEDSYFFSEMGLYMLAVSLCTIPLLVGTTWWMQRLSLKERLHKGMVSGHRNVFRPLSQWVQLVVCMGLIFFTSVIILQLHYLRNSTDIGFKYQNRAIFYCLRNPEKSEHIANYLRSHPDVEEVMIDCRDIYNPSYSRLIYNDENIHTKTIAFKKISRKEIDFWGLELIEGRWIEDHEEEFALANESAVKFLNLTSPVDTFVRDVHLHIKGVVRNVSGKSLIVPQEPMLYVPKPKEKKESEWDDIAFSYRPGTWPAIRDSINSRLKGFENNEYDCKLSKIEESFNNLLHSEDKLLGLFYIMTAVCIIIALFGTYSLITISCEQRRKEIAVRKVFGARTGDILRLFFIEQTAVLVAAGIVAFPIAYVCVKPWLEGYIHQVAIPLWLYPAIFLLITLLVTVCIGWRVWKTAHAHAAEEIGKG